MGKPTLPDSVLDEAIDAYYLYNGNKSEAARFLELKRQTYNDRLNMATQRFGITLGKIANGRVKAKTAIEKPLPLKGQTARYILTSIQNNTHLHASFANMQAFAKFYDAELIIGTYSYQLASYGPKAVKRGKHRRQDAELWYAPEAKPYIVDESVQLAPGLIWAGEQNILPTAKHPLTGFEDYNGRASNIVPHAKIAMESVASMADEPTKFNYSTGTITQRNYLQKRAGILAEQKHSYGGLLVEVDHNGVWFVRQLHVDEDGSIMDIGPVGTSGVVARDGQVSVEPTVLSVYLADVHAAELDVWVKDATWGDGGFIDQLRPSTQFAGDVFSMSSRSPHETKDFHQRYLKHTLGAELVDEEVQQAADVLNDANRDFCELIIVPANHDRHLNRWLNEADFRVDPANAKYFCWLQYNVLDAIDRGDKDFNILEFALVEAGLDKSVRFLSTDESFLVAGIENGLHGDLGPNGARGSTKGLTKLGRPINKGHDHSAAIRDGVYSAGVCSFSFGYTKGPSSHSVSHIVTYRNGSRAVITMFDGRFRT